MADILKSIINKILSLLPIPKINFNLSDIEKESKIIALLGEEERG